LAGNYPFDIGIAMCRDSAVSTAREVEAGAPAEDEIEITPEMIEAGYLVFAHAGLEDALLEADRLTVAEIYLAMRRLCPGRAAGQQRD
jgi:hypothetical protein